MYEWLYVAAVYSGIAGCSGAVLRGRPDLVYNKPREMHRVSIHGAPSAARRPGGVLRGRGPLLHESAAGPPVCPRQTERQTSSQLRGAE